MIQCLQTGLSISNQARHPRPHTDVRKSRPNTVLVGEDTASTLYLVSKLLEFDGYRVLKASTGEEIINQALQESPDVILMDIMLQGSNGLDLIPVLRNKLKKTKICIMSIIEDEEIIQKTIQSGADDYIIKPICPETLYHKTKVLCGSGEERPTYYSYCDLGIILRNDYETMPARIIGVSDFSIKVRLQKKIDLMDFYRFQSKSLNKILGRTKDLFGRITKKEGTEVHIELVGLSPSESLKLSEFLSREHYFSDTTLHN